MSEPEKPATVQDQAKQVMDALAILVKNAQFGDTDSVTKPFATKLEDKKTENVTKLSTEESTVKQLKGFKTFTFLDQMFLNGEEKPIDGIPIGTSAICTGIPNTGKSLLIAEIALRVANEGHKVCFTTSEEIWRTKTERFDLENRMREKAKILGLDWQKISQNLFVLDAVAHADLRDWSNFVSTLRNLVETEKIELLLIDSLTLLEDSRNALKYRLLELMKYGQIHGLTSILISQRAIDEVDGLALAGGIGLSHIADIVFVLENKKLSSWDATMKMDLGAKQSETVNFFRILKNRISKYDGHYHGYTITKDGFVRLNPKLADQKT
jgi:KaiC/GvpD/RAD55 family RecA-like ATPase